MKSARDACRRSAAASCWPSWRWLTQGRWVELPDGRFEMGAQSGDSAAPGFDPEAKEWESPLHPVEVSAFAIARYPVTVFEYAGFVEDGGYRDQRWWNAGGYGDNDQPERWDPQQEHPSRPVTGVSWHEAAAWCAWLTEQLSRPCGVHGEVPCDDDHEVRLPTEAEWEFAARGSAGRRYPWGDEQPSGGRANFNQSEVGAASPVGVFPSGNTPDGLVDMVGNVWEWCVDVYDEEYYRRCLPRGVVSNPVGGDEAAGPRVLRGGAFGIVSAGLRAAVRVRVVGFRCVRAPRRQP